MSVSVPVLQGFGFCSFLWDFFLYFLCVLCRNFENGLVIISIFGVKVLFTYLFGENA